MKRILAFSVAICMMLSLCGCGTGTMQSQAAKPQSTQEDEVQPDEAQIDLNRLVDTIKGFIKEDIKPKIGIVLGSGLGRLAKEIDVVQEISYGDIPGLPYSTVEGHDGKYVFGYIGDIPVILMSGRVHYYEGYSMEEVVTPVRVMAKLGAETIILTNATGGLRKEYPPGSLVCIDDHISSFVPNPLIGQNDESLGVRFVDMSNAYDDSLKEIAHKAADELNIDLKDGVFVQVSGPSFETPAECNMFAALGADVVGMSTVCETIALRHMDVRVLGISCVTNYSPNVENRSQSHEEVEETAEKISDDFISLIKNIVSKIGK